MAKGDKQEMIIDAALEVFREKGYANARMADIARRAGVSYGLVYHYFGSKEVLFNLIVGTWWNDLYSMMEREKASNADFRQKLVHIITFFLDTYAQKPNLISIFVSEVCRSSVYHTEEGLAKFLKFFSLCEEIMLEGQQKGILKKEISPHHLTYIFYGAIETFISVMVLGKEPLTRKREERAVNAILEVFMDGAKAAV
ncbi:MAG: TetR/AcrR family transcriptional regulator [Desulfomonilia bacterium]|uniref:Fatty acid metabolism regulator protein n=1 Tax=anaerobic digester metagenome TaxID=1263854 RepID=A0A485M4P5_9ZZZZ|nr:TetR/AcrR family transcriptional regulator [Pseudomonadota bacterium]HON38195.1 TetR/AcrR family transcriptional regulator [Deltaproteobacteria bacterium]HRS56456.1 TetR/AcrR family transcriptional regulator [Desulfomonilia bacterium]HPD22718.1 TetR/AcrR family transcriptional regulator [Deltaproteobacteria bacterium]HPW69500.1 TetR/AcrR family transcriptional regulator [Deltaproteobacteria bacterium]